MATSPLGGFADLSDYTPTAIARRRALQVSPLDALLQGVQQGIALEQLPQQLEQQALNQQLQQALNQAKLEQLQNPELAAQRQLQQAALEGIISGRNPNLVFQPQVDPQVQALRDVALQEGGIPQPASDFQQLIAASGGTPAIGISPSIGEAIRKRQVDAKLAADEARYRTLGVPTRRGVDEFGNEVLIPTRVFGGEAVTSIPVLGTGGAPLKAQVKSGARPLTETAKSALLTRAGKFGVVSSDEDLNRFKNEAGEIDIERLSVASGRAERESLASEKESKLNQTPAEARSKVAAYQAVQKDLERLREKLNEELVSGDIPSATQDVISASLAEAPGNFFSRAFQRFVLQPAQSKTAAENERLRGAVSASIGRAIAGASLTGTEKQNLIPFSPQAGDSFERLLEKSAGLEQFLQNQIDGLTTPIPSGVSSPVATPGINPNAPAPVRSGNTFRIIR